jgi:hypothetical protein
MMKMIPVILMNKRAVQVILQINKMMMNQTYLKTNLKIIMIKKSKISILKMKINNLKILSPIMMNKGQI